MGNETLHDKIPTRPFLKIEYKMVNVRTNA